MRLSPRTTGLNPVEDVVRYAHVAEAFKAPDNTCRPSLHEQHEEIVVIQARDYDGEVAGIRSIVRPESGKPYLEQLQIMRDVGIDRFSGLLPPRVQH